MPPVQEALQPTLSILVVDDDQDVCAYLEDFLTSEGHGVRTVGNPCSAADELRTGDYHICILDLMMPNLSGLELLDQIRRIDVDIAIIILTGHPSLETAAISIEHEVSAYLRKPFASDELRTAICRIARRKGLATCREEELHASIGRTIRELRRDRGLTLKQVARRTNLSVSLLSQIERAESSASVSSLFKVATALEVKLTDLFSGY